MSLTSDKSTRFPFIDQFRGFIIVLMLVDHSSYYLNSIWLHLDPFDPLFDSWAQMALRYVSYLCAPGFLMINGAMVWWTYNKRMQKGVSSWAAKRHFMHRGLFLIVLQMTWVNSSWGGFAAFQPWHMGIIACIGFSMIFQSLVVNWRWQFQLALAIAILLVHPLLLQIPYEKDGSFWYVIMQTFVDAGDFNKYPVLPWFALALLGSVMANGWLKAWKSENKQIVWSIVVATAAFLIAIIIRMGRGYGNLLAFSDFGTYSFFFDQKYPPSLFFSVWFFGCVVLFVALMIAVNKVAPKILSVFDIVGKTALFFYCMHIALFGVFSKRLDFLYREGDVTTTLIGVAVMMIIMLPLSKWYFKIKLKSKNYFIRMI